MREVYLYDGNVLRLKLTCEERSDGICIATLWEPDMCLENDREVEEFETYSAALARMYEKGLERALQYSNLRMYGKMKRNSA